MDPYSLGAMFLMRAINRGQQNKANQQGQLSSMMADTPKPGQGGFQGSSPFGGGGFTGAQARPPVDLPTLGSLLLGG